MKISQTMKSLAEIMLAHGDLTVAIDTGPILDEPCDLRFLELESVEVNTKVLWDVDDKMKPVEKDLAILSIN